MCPGISIKHTYYMPHYSGWAFQTSPITALDMRRWQAGHTVFRWGHVTSPGSLTAAREVVGCDLRKRKGNNINNLWIFRNLSWHKSPKTHNPFDCWNAITTFWVCVGSVSQQDTELWAPLIQLSGTGPRVPLGKEITLKWAAASNTQCFQESNR